MESEKGRGLYLSISQEKNVPFNQNRCAYECTFLSIKQLKSKESSLRGSSLFKYSRIKLVMLLCVTVARRM